MANVSSSEDKKKWLAQKQKEKDNDPEFQKMLKAALRAEREKLIKISESHRSR